MKLQLYKCSETVDTLLIGLPFCCKLFSPILTDGLESFVFNRDQMMPCDQDVRNNLSGSSIYSKTLCKVFHKCSLKVLYHAFMKKTIIQYLNIRNRIHQALICQYLFSMHA